jgi:hypothetical protein
MIVPFENELSSVDVAGDVRRQTNSTAPFPAGIHPSRSNFVHILSVSHVNIELPAKSDFYSY